MMRRKVAICVLAVSLIAAGCGQTNKAAAQGTDSGVSADSYVASPGDSSSVAAPIMESWPEDPEAVRIHWVSPLMCTIIRTVRPYRRG